MTETPGEVTASDELAVTRRRLAELQAATLVDLRAAGVELEQMREALRSRDAELTDTRARLDETSRRLAAVTGSGSYRLARGLRLLVHPIEAWRRRGGGAAQ